MSEVERELVTERCDDQHPEWCSERPEGKAVRKRLPQRVALHSRRGPLCVHVAIVTAGASGCSPRTASRHPP